MTLVEFLLARIADDRKNGSEISNPKERRTTIEGPAAPEVRLFANPARVLAECEAKLRIMEDAYEMTADSTMCGHGWRLMEFLALPYADHPDYDPKWSVS